MGPYEIKGFFGNYRWLSNFYRCEVVYDGLIYPTVENAYQAAKVREEDRNRFQIINPGEAKRLARRFNMVEGWDKEKVMMHLLRQKFSKSPWKKLLLKTGDTYLEETNTWGDTYWGVYNGEGENTLGKMIMEIREELKGGLKDDRCKQIS